MVAELIFKNKILYDAITTLVTPRIQHLINTALNDGCQYDFKPYRLGKYCIVIPSPGAERLVDINQKTCTCGEYQATHFFCCHVACVIAYAKLNPIEFINPTFIVSSKTSLIYTS